MPEQPYERTFKAGSVTYTLSATRGGTYWLLTLTGEDIYCWSCRVALSTVDQGSMEETIRHLARNATNGNLPTPPMSKVEVAMWDAAVGLALAFIERHGTLKEWREELSR